MPFLSQIRLRVFAVLAGLITAVVATISLTAWPALPVIGVAIITAAAVVNTMTSRLASPVCAGCGGMLNVRDSGAYGVMCQSCGTLTQIDSVAVLEDDATA
ncbi:MAG: hypothetical protein DHS20C14_10410 [Phycisphaeraceae bacterium]|nr:MAG: hypothetical protein DHS20C14_10410 [Phycisphaeraceae bacterium]